VTNIDPTSNGHFHVCPDCKNQFVQPFVCTTCGAQKLYDETVHSQGAAIERAKRIMQRAVSWLQIKEAAFASAKGPAIIEEMQRYIGDLPVADCKHGRCPHWNGPAAVIANAMYKDQCPWCDLERLGSIIGQLINTAQIKGEPWDSVHNMHLTNMGDTILVNEGLLWKLMIAAHISPSSGHSKEKPEQQAQPEETREDLLRIIGDIHEAVGEDRDSDNASLAGCIRQLLADLRGEIDSQEASKQVGE